MKSDISVRNSILKITKRLCVDIYSYKFADISVIIYDNFNQIYEFIMSSLPNHAKNILYIDRTSSFQSNKRKMLSISNLEDSLIPESTKITA